MSNTYYWSLPSAIKAYPRLRFKPGRNYWKKFYDPDHEKPPFVSGLMHALPRRDFMFKNRIGAHIFSFPYYLGLANYMFLWMIIFLIVSAVIFIRMYIIKRSRKEISLRQAKTIQNKMYTLSLINVLIAICITFLVEASFVLMLKFLYIYHTCKPPIEYLRVKDGVELIKNARDAATTAEFRKKYRKLLNKNHADINFMKLYYHLVSQLYNLRYIIKTTIFQGTCPVAYWRTLFYTVTANVLWALVPYLCIQMLLVVRGKPTRTGFHRIKKWALINFLSCWSLAASLLWLVMIASDYCYTPAITTANQTYRMDSLTPYYLKVMPFRHIRDAINFFIDMNKFVNHTRFGDAYYIPNFAPIYILEMATKFFYDLLEEAVNDTEVNAMLHDIGDPKAIKNALNLSVDEGLIGLYKGKFIRPIHNRLMVIACRYWVPVVLAVLTLLWIMFGTSAFIIVYAIKAIEHLPAFVEVGPIHKKKVVIQKGEWARRVKSLQDKEIDREKKENEADDDDICALHNRQRTRRRSSSTLRSVRRMLPHIRSTRSKLLARGRFLRRALPKDTFTHSAFTARNYADKLIRDDTITMPPV